MRGLWSAESKIIAERRLWIAVLTAQRDLGVDFGGADPDAVIAAYQGVLDQVDLGSIAARERVTRHDVKARIEEFNALAGFEQVHKGMTSRDLTENVEQLQIRSSLTIVRDRIVAALVRLGRLAAEYADLAMAGRSHNVAAQITTLGKRFATAANELIVAYERIEELIARYPLRGIKGPVGTGQDMLDLLGGDAERLAELEQRVADAPRLHPGPGQHRPGLSAVPGLRRGDRPGPGGGGAVQRRHEHPADGRARAGDRGLPARAGGVQRDAAQDEHPLLRAGQRAGGGRPRLRVDGGRAGRRPVERGRRLVLGGAPGRPAGRLLRPRRAVRDLPQRARRLRRLPGRDRGRAAALPAVPGDDQGADGRRTRRHRPGDRSRGHQGARGGGGAGDAGDRRRQRPAATAGRRRPARDQPSPSWTRRSPAPSTWPAPPAGRSRPSSPRSRRSPPRIRRPRRTSRGWCSSRPPVRSAGRTPAGSGSSRRGRSGTAAPAAGSWPRRSGGRCWGSGRSGGRAQRRRRRSPGRRGGGTAGRQGGHGGPFSVTCGVRPVWPPTGAGGPPFAGGTRVRPRERPAPPWSSPDPCPVRRRSEVSSCVAPTTQC